MAKNVETENVEQDRSKKGATGNCRVDFKSDSRDKKQESDKSRAKVECDSEFVHGNKVKENIYV